MKIRKLKITIEKLYKKVPGTCIYGTLFLTEVKGFVLKIVKFQDFNTTVQRVTNKHQLLLLQSVSIDVHQNYAILFLYFHLLSIVL